MHYSLGNLGIKKTIKGIHSLDSYFSSSLLSFQNISNNHLDRAGAEAITNLLLEDLSSLHALRVSGDLYAQNNDSSGSEIMCFLPVSHAENISQTMGKISLSNMSLMGTQHNSGNLDLE